MRRNLRKMLAAACAVALLATVAVQLASSATTSSTRSIPARVKALESKVKKLTARVSTLNGSVATLQSDVATLKTKSDCLGAQGITQYGNPSARQGYLYTPDGVNVGVTTAFDAPASGQTPTFYAATVAPTCVGSASFRLQGGTAPHTTAVLRTR
jgi:outer membrane murein-binding lipoprotein Lpp